ncbi:restriction endonuclease subunit S [Streptomyces rochei]|uniref:restriction endonuclease subunit S n=1 Tax=Streptomyces rochei TaxID=1928 RepID=UPI003414CD52
MTTDSGVGPGGSGSEGDVTSELPPGWVRTTLGEIISPISDRYKPTAGDDLPYLGMDNVESHTGRVMNFGSAASIKSSSPIVRPGYLLYGRLRPYLNKVVLADFDGICSGEFIVFPPSEAIDSRFLLHRLLSPDFVRYVMRKNPKGDRPRAYWEQFSNFPVLLPPLSEQHRIVAKLDEQLANIEAGEVSLADAEARIVAFVASLLADATKPSADWEIKTIGEMATVSSGATPLKGRSDYYDGGTVPWITSSLLNAPFVDRAEKFITDRAVAETAVKQYPPGTLLLAMYGEGKTRGKCSELRIHATTNQACAGIQFAAEYECRKDWVKLVLESRYEENRALASGGVQPNLSLGLIKRIQVPLPPLTRQKELLDQVAQRRADAGEMSDVIESVKIQAAELRNALLDAAFTGALVPQDPEDEPASVLLDRIRAERTAVAKQTRRKRVSRATSLAAPQTSGPQEALPL